MNKLCPEAVHPRGPAEGPVRLRIKWYSSRSGNAPAASQVGSPSSNNHLLESYVGRSNLPSLSCATHDEYRQMYVMNLIVLLARTRSSRRYHGLWSSTNDQPLEL